MRGSVQKDYASALRARIDKAPIGLWEVDYEAHRKQARDGRKSLLLLCAVEPTLSEAVVMMLTGNGEYHADPGPVPLNSTKARQ